MATTTDYLTQLQRDKQTLVDNLVSKGVSATSDETFTSLVPKVAEITSGGFEINDASYLFASNRRLDEINKILPLCINATDLSYLFYQCTNLTEVDLSNFKPKKSVNISNMFATCKNLTKINLSGLYGAKITNMSSMFSNCISLTKLDLSYFDTSNVNSMSSICIDCTNLMEVNLSNLDTSQFTIYGMNYMFKNCTNLTKIIINSPNVLTIKGSNIFQNSAIANGSGYVYVPDNLVETYKTSKNWSTYASQIKGISELPVEEG